MKVTRKYWADCPVFFIGCEGLIDGESCPREGVNGMPRKPDERMLCRLDFDPNDVKLIKNSEVSGFRVLI